MPIATSYNARALSRAASPATLSGWPEGNITVGGELSYFVLKLIFPTSHYVSRKRF